MAMLRNQTFPLVEPLAWLFMQTLGRIWPLVRVLSEAKQFKIAEAGIDQVDM